MKIYLDNCCFNRPFDDQSQLRVRLETEAKLKIQEDIRAGVYRLVWSYLLDYENSKNPFQERRRQILKWRNYAKDDIDESMQLLEIGNRILTTGVKKIDALHIACAIMANSDYFMTTDDGILKKAALIQPIKIIDPIGFIREVT
ncbi:conserved hypothetical protein [Crenothrix polyspora]|uniref:PIN domain-containing protein n=1 Tax=Crenothrix polyspora TaxID=360316 RepID=A0A1R4GYT2_9GAMM|nr:PIN domain protein [Crenothrix polyspora]SJM89143.1 conserved hypothetical protein [Crenothrix polyspora]